MISFRLLGDDGFERWFILINVFCSSFSILCVCVTAIEGVGLTIPVGVVVDAIDVDVLIVERQVVWVVVEMVLWLLLLLLCCLEGDFCWLVVNGWAMGGNGGSGYKINWFHLYFIHLIVQFTKTVTNQFVSFCFFYFYIHQLIAQISIDKSQKFLNITTSKRFKYKHWTEMGWGWRWRER